MKSALVKMKPHRHTASLQNRGADSLHPNRNYEGLPADPMRGTSPGMYNSASISEYGNLSNNGQPLNQ